MKFTGRVIYTEMPDGRVTFTPIMRVDWSDVLCWIFGHERVIDIGPDINGVPLFNCPRCGKVAPSLP